MATPAEDLAAYIATLEGLPAGLNIYGAPQAKVMAPAIVIRPGGTWMAQANFCAHLERYSAICVVSASTPEDGIAMLRTLSLAVIDGLQSPWDWESVEGPVIDQTTGVPFLANRVNLERAAEGGNGCLRSVNRQLNALEVAANVNAGTARVAVSV